MQKSEFERQAFTHQTLINKPSARGRFYPVSYRPFSDVADVLYTEWLKDAVNELNG